MAPDTVRVTKPAQPPPLRMAPRPMRPRSAEGQGLAPVLALGQVLVPVQATGRVPVPGWALTRRQAGR